MTRIQFNVPIGEDTHLGLARRMLDDHRAWLTDPSFEARVRDDGVEVHTRQLAVTRLGAGPAHDATTLLTRVAFAVDASRDRCFALIGDPARSAEWDPLDRGHELVQSYDPDHLVMRTFTKPPPPWQMRESLLYMVTDRPDAGPWVHCMRAVEHPGCPTGRLRRALQQHFGWSVESTGAESARVTALATIPENLLPMWLLRLANVRGWLGLARKVRRLILAG